MSDQARIPAAFAEADPDGAGDRVALTFTGGRRLAIATEAGSSPGTIVWLALLGLLSAGSATRRGSLGVAALAGAAFVATLLRRWRTLHISGRLDRIPVTVVLDDEGITRVTPGRTVTLPWNVWYRAYRRLGVWHIRLAAAPLEGLALPDAVLTPGQRKRLRRMLADHDLLRTPWY